MVKLAWHGGRSEHGSILVTDWFVLTNVISCYGSSTAQLDNRRDVLTLERTL